MLSSVRRSGALRWLALALLVHGLPAFGQARPQPMGPGHPAVFLMPQPPKNLKDGAVKLVYTVEAMVDEQGVPTGVSVQPEDPAFKALVEDAARFWVFYPRVDFERCVPLPSTAKVELTYRHDAEPSAAVLVPATADAIAAPEGPKVVTRPGRTALMHAWLQRQTAQRFVIVMLAVIDAKGRVVESRPILQLPASENLLAYTQEQLARTLFQPAQQERRCAQVATIIQRGIPD